MNPNQKTIETPVGKHQVILKEWITGRDREYIDAPLLKSVDAKPRMNGQKMDFEMGKFDMNNFVTESDHREIERFVISIDGKIAHQYEGKELSNLDFILDAMHEDDTKFIKDTIKEVTQKKRASPQQ